MSGAAFRLTGEPRFQSRKFPTTPPDLVPIRVSSPKAWPALEVLADSYRPFAPAFVDELEAAMVAAGWQKDGPAKKVIIHDADPGSPLRLIMYGDHGDQAIAEITPRRALDLAVQLLKTARARWPGDSSP